jgi:hypothetical protein
MFPDPSSIGPDGQLEPSFGEFPPIELDDPAPPSAGGYLGIFAGSLLLLIVVVMGLMVCGAWLTR